MHQQLQVTIAALEHIQNESLTKYAEILRETDAYSEVFKM